MREDTMQLQRAVEDILASLSMRSLASYCPTSPSISRPSSEPPNSKGQPLHHREGATSHPNVRFQDAPPLKLEGDRAHQVGFSMAREQSQHEEHDGQSLFSNPMGSLYEVTRLRGARGGAGSRGGVYPEEIDADFISRGLISPAEAQELFVVYRPRPV
jgi:hypothetical protein